MSQLPPSFLLELFKNSNWSKNKSGCGTVESMKFEKFFLPLMHPKLVHIENPYRDIKGM
jgi:hypothetical protein